jgi:hypothetical protein
MSQTQTLSERVLARVAQRPRFVRAARTNDPLLPPPGLSGVELRRWRDVTAHYVEQLGERFEQEHVRVLAGQLVSLTLLAERQQAAVARGEEVEPIWVIQGTQTILRLLAELGFEHTAQSTVAPRVVVVDRAQAERTLRELGLTVPDFDSIVDENTSPPPAQQPAAPLPAPVVVELKAEKAQPAPPAVEVEPPPPPPSPRIPSHYERYARAAGFSPPGAKS